MRRYLLIALALLWLPTFVMAQAKDSTSAAPPPDSSSSAIMPTPMATDTTAHAIVSAPVPAIAPSLPPDTATVSATAIAKHDSMAAPAADAVSAPIPTAHSKQDSLSVQPASHKFVLKRLPQVAVLLFTGEGISAKDLSTVTNRFESELLASDSFKIVERRNIDKILKEQGFQQSGACDNSECSVEIGQLLSVQGIFTGDLSKVGKTWSLSVKKTDVGSGQTEFSHVLDIQGGLEDVLRGGCAEMALIASGKKKPDNSHTVLVAQSSGHVWPWIVGGVVVAGGAAAAVVLLTQDKSSSSSSPRNVSVTW